MPGGLELGARSRVYRGRHETRPGHRAADGRAASSPGRRANRHDPVLRAGRPAAAPRRTDGEHRRYGPDDLHRLLFIRGAQRLGLRLAEIRELLAVRDTGTCACEPAEALLRRHVAEIGTEIERLAALRAELLVMLAAMPGPDCPTRCPAPGALRPHPTRKEVTAMCPCCGTSTCDGSCCDGVCECC